jgi:Transcriptional regulatory protein, C terminal
VHIIGVMEAPGCVGERGGPRVNGKAGHRRGGGLYVGVLGPLEVRLGGRAIDLTTGRLRALLAMSAGRGMPPERLAAAVWGTDRPTKSRRSVQTYLTRLRNVLGDEAIQTGPDGYLLATDNVDALRFARLLDTAAGLQDGGQEPGPAVDELHRQIHLGGTTLQMGEDEVCAPPPRQLPAGIGWFSGRTQILARLDALLEHATTTTVTAVIAGGPGMVKTALAVHWAHQVSGDFPDGQLYLDLRGFHASGHPLHDQPPGCRPASTRGIRSNLCLTPPVAVCAAWERRWHEMTRTP